MEELGAVISDSEPVGGRSEGDGKFLQGGGIGGVAVWGGDVGPHPDDGAGPGNSPTQGREGDNQKAAVATGGWDLGILASGGGTGGSGFRGDKEDVQKEAEHGRAVYCEAINYGPL